MEITLLGAAGTVTGSSYLVATDRARLLVDFGFFQGRDEGEDGANRVPDAVDPGALDGVLLTHAHIDHVGRLPLLAQRDFQKPVYGTAATGDLTRLVLDDSAGIQEGDARRTNEQRERDGRAFVKPLYNKRDADLIMEQVRAVPYEESIQVAPGITARWIEAGHMLGSASIRLIVEEKGRRKTVVFSGDIGQRGTPLLRDPESFRHADYVFLESTYGDRNHRGYKETVDEFEQIMRDLIAKRGRMLMPAFAVGRTQTLLYLFARLFRSGAVKPIPIYLDSPMAIDATQIYFSHPELVDDEMTAMLAEAPISDDLESVSIAETPDQSRIVVEQARGPCAVIAASGMCEAGRILHHLKRNLSDPSTVVVFTGFQGQGTLGRRLVDGAQEVTIHGEPVSVAAQVHTLNGFSAHAGRDELVKWLGSLAKSKPGVALVHGEQKPREALRAALQSAYGLAADLPMQDETVTI